MPRSFGRCVVALLLGACAASCGARSSIDVGGWASNEGGAAGTSSSSSSSSGSAACAPEVFSVGGPGAVYLEMDATHAYFTTADDKLMRARFGGGPEEILVEGRPTLGDIALYDGFVYFSDEKTIARVPLAGGPIEDLAELTHGASYSIAVDASGVYWMNGGAGFFSVSYERLSPDGERSLLLEQVDYGTGIAIDGDRLLFAANGVLGVNTNDMIAAVPKLGGPVSVIASNLPGQKIPFAFGDWVYWVEERDEAFTNHGGIARAPKAGGPREKVVSLEGRFPIWGSTDGARYYITTIAETMAPTELAVADAPKGGPLTLVSQGKLSDFYTQTAADAARVVWTVQRASASMDPVDGVRVLCREQIP